MKFYNAGSNLVGNGNKGVMPQMIKRAFGLCKLILLVKTLGTPIWEKLIINARIFRCID